MTDFKIIQIAIRDEETKKKVGVQHCPMIIWRVAIDGDDRTHGKANKGIANLTLAFGHVSIQGMIDDDDDDVDEW
jgi:hypothetical protein